MSEFSETIKNEIKQSKRTLLYLSDASGLSLDHISKMRQGKRLPQDEEKVKKLIYALECSEERTRMLLSLYKIEKMGVDEWNCMQEIQKILEYRAAFLELPDEPGEVSEDFIKNTCVLEGRIAIFSFIRNALRVKASQQNIPGGGDTSPFRLYARSINRNIGKLSPI